MFLIICAIAVCDLCTHYFYCMLGILFCTSPCFLLRPQNDELYRVLVVCQSETKTGASPTSGYF